MPTASDPPLARPLEHTFSALSRLRGKRIFHPHGVGFDALFEPLGGIETAAELFDGDERRAIVRLSRSIGLPEALGDPCGLAFRISDAYGPGRHQDFLLVTSARPRIARHLLLPSRGFSARIYSSLLPYRVGERTALVGAEPLGPAPGPSLAELRAGGASDLSFAITVATPRGEWHRVAHLHLGSRLPDKGIEDMRLSPYNAGGGIEPTGLLNRLRPPAYDGSQDGRKAGDTTPRPAADPAAPTDRAGTIGAPGR